MQEATPLEEKARPDLRPSVRRPGSDRGPGHDRPRDPAPAPAADRCDLRSSGRRRPDLGDRRLREENQSENSHRGRGADRRRCHGALAQGREENQARSRGPLRRRRGGQGGRARDLSPVPRAWSTRWCSPTPTRCAPRSRTCSRTRASCSSPPARSPSPARRLGGKAWLRRTRRSWRSPPARTPTSTGCASSPRRRSSASTARRSSRSPSRSGRAASGGSAALLGARNVTEFNYRIADSREAHIFVGVEVQGREETARIVRNLRRNGLTTLDLSDNDLAKLHTRHMVGGRAPRSPRTSSFTGSSSPSGRAR